jgi:hypothetical protein
MVADFLFNFAGAVSVSFCQPFAAFKSFYSEGAGLAKFIYLDDHKLSGLEPTNSGSTIRRRQAQKKENS